MGRWAAAIGLGALTAASAAWAQVDVDRLNRAAGARFGVGRTVHELGTAVALSPLDATYFTLRLMLAEEWGEPEADGGENALPPVARDNVLALFSRYHVRGGQDRLSLFAVASGGTSAGEDPQVRAGVVLGFEYIVAGIAGLGLGFASEPRCDGWTAECTGRQTRLLVRPAVPIAGVFTQVGMALADLSVPHALLSYAPWEFIGDRIGLTPVFEYRWDRDGGHWLQFSDDAVLHDGLDRSARKLQFGLPADLRVRADGGPGAFVASGLSLFSVADHIVARRGPARAPRSSRRRGRAGRSSRGAPPADASQQELRRLPGRPLQLVRFIGSGYDNGRDWIPGFALRIDLIPGLAPSMPTWSLQARLNHADDLDGIPAAEGIYFIGMWVNFVFSPAHGLEGDGWGLGFP